MTTIPDNTSTNATITAGGSVQQSSIDSLGDRDWFRTTFDAGLSYTIKMEGTGTGTELTRPEFFIHDASGTQVGNFGDGGNDGLVENIFTPTTGGTYYISAAGYNDGLTGDYLLSIQDDNAANTVATTRTIAPGGTVADTIEGFGDRDWFRMTGEAGFSYNITLEGTGTGTELPRTEFYVYDASGTQIGNFGDGNNDGTVSGLFTPTTDGTYYVAAGGYNDGTRGDYVLTVEDDDARNSIETEQSITPGQSVNASIEGLGDRDWFRMTGEAGFSYNITLEGTGTGTELARPEFYIYDASGTQIGNFSDGNNDGITFGLLAPSTDGIYYIAAGGYNDGVTGDYVLTVEDDDTRNSINTEQSIVPGQSVTASIEGFGDRDWFRVSGEEGFSYNIKLEGTGTGTELTRTEFYVYDAAGTLVGNIGDSNADGVSEAIYTATADGDFYVAAGGTNDGFVGDYELSVDTDDTRNSIATTRSITPGGSATGSIEGIADRDWFRVGIEEGFTYTVRLEGIGGASELARTEYYLYDSAGTQFGNASDFNGDGVAQNRFFATSDGDIYIAAGGLNDDYRGNYRLSLTDDDTRSTIATEKSIAVGQATTGDIEGVGDRDWYRISLQAGEEYAITLKGDGSSDTLDQVELRVHDSSGTQIANVDDFGTLGTQTLLFTPTQNGTYYISAEGEDDVFAGKYILSVAGERPVTTGTNQDDTLVGDDADENFSGLGGDDVIIGGGGDDEIDGGKNDDIIIAGSGNDQVFDGSGNDDVYLGDGDDFVRVNGGQDDLDGGDGYDTISYFESGGGVQVNLATNAVSGGMATGDTIMNFEAAQGSNTGDDIITGTSDTNEILTYGGNDRVDAGGGNDIVRGGSGNDSLYGESGNDMLFGGNGNDRVFDGTGNDDVFLGNGDDFVRVEGGQDDFNGGDGYDTISYFDSNAGVQVDLEAETASGGMASGDTVKNFEAINGSNIGGDTITGTSGDNGITTNGGADTVFAGNGDDTVRGGNGSDTLHGESGDDQIYGGKGNDRVFDGSGNDEVILGNGDDFVRVDGGNDDLDGGDGFDTISYFQSGGGVQVNLTTNVVSGGMATGDTIANFEAVSGSNTGGDTIVGSSVANTINTYGGSDEVYAGGGDDIVRGGNGNDALFGGSGKDSLFGGNGRDDLEGQGGDDSLTGGNGLDTFHFDLGGRKDTIMDFQDDIDTIQFSGFTFANGQDAIDFADNVNGDVVFDFGGGDTLTVRNTTTTLLADDYEVV